MFRVLHIGLCSEFVGIESFLLNVYKNIDKKKIQFDFIASANNPDVINPFKKLGGTIHIVPFDIFYYSSLQKIISENHYETVHIHKNSLANPIPIFICKILHVQNIILHSHSTNIDKGRFFKFLHYINKQIFSRLCGVKLACSSEAGCWMFPKGTKYKIIKNGIELERFTYNSEVRNDKRKEFSVSNADILLGTVGRITFAKNQLFLLDVLKLVQVRFQSAKLFFCGDGLLRKDLEQKILSSGLSGSVILTGARKDVHEILNALDVFLLPSRYEGLGIVAIEAQANGLPCIVSNAVPDECNISSSFIRIDNCDDVNSWSENIKRYNIRNRDAYKQCTLSGYDICNTVNILKKIYMGIGEDCENKNI